MKIILLKRDHKAPPIGSASSLYAGALLEVRRSELSLAHMSQVRPEVPMLPEQHCSRSGFNASGRLFIRCWVATMSNLNIGSAGSSLCPACKVNMSLSALHLRSMVHAP